jgi:hypothetical protein
MRKVKEKSKPKLKNQNLKICSQKKISTKFVAKNNKNLQQKFVAKNDTLQQNLLSESDVFTKFFLTQFELKNSMQ